MPELQISGASSRETNYPKSPSTPPRFPSFSPPPPPPPEPETTAKVYGGSTNTSFREGEDFISFAPSSETDSEPESDDQRNRDRKGKQPVNSNANGNSRKRKSSPMAAGRERARNTRPRIEPVPSRTTPWMRYVDWSDCMNAAEMLNRELEGFIEYITPSEEEHQVRSMVVETIRQAIVAAYPDAVLTPFGSFDTKLYLPTGDIDLVLKSAAMERHEKKKILYSLANLLRRAGIATHVTVIAKARVPIIKFVSKLSNIPVDISVNQGNGVVAGEVINSFLKEIPAARGIVFLVKMFLNQRGINEVFSGGLGSYSTVLMVISFLQMHPKVRRAEIDPMRNLGVLSNEFLEFYGKYFNFTDVGISVLDGGAYFTKESRGWGDPTRRFLISVEDPCDTDNDVSKGSFAYGRVRTAFAGAYEALTLSILTKARRLQAMHQRRSSRDDVYDPDRRFADADYASILGSIIGVTEEMIEQRQLLNSIWDRGTLHAQLNRTKPPKERPRRETKPTSTANGEISNGKARSENKSQHHPYSTLEERDMLLSDEEVDNVASAFMDEEEFSKYRRGGVSNSRGGSKARLEPGEVVYISDDDASEGESIASPPPPRSPTAGGKRTPDGVIRRNRDYWTAKGSSRGGEDDVEHS